jgi:hypothetical protein
MAAAKIEVALEQWLRTEGVARYDAFHRNPRRGRPAAEVFARLRAHHVERKRKRARDDDATE